MMDINVELLQWFTTFLIKKLLEYQSKIKLCRIKNQLKNNINQLLESLKKQKVHSFFWIRFSADIADMRLILVFNIDMYSKYEQVMFLKHKKVLQLLFLKKK